MNVSPWLRYHATVHKTLDDAIADTLRRCPDSIHRVYLCGGINSLNDAECKNWRTIARERLSRLTIVDPMDRDYRGREDDCYREIVEGDKKDIIGCDVMLVNAYKPSWGTAMEIMYAWIREDIDIIVFMEAP